MSFSWYPPADRPLRPGGPLWIGFTSICILSLLAPPSRSRTALTIPALLCVLAQVRGYTSGKREEDYMVAVNLVVASIKYIDFVLMRTPEHTVFRADSSAKQIESPQDLQAARLWNKFRWAASLFATLRGIGWNWQVKNVDEVPKGTTRSAFVRRQILGFFYSYLASDFLAHILRFGEAARIHSSMEYFSRPLLEQVCLGWAITFRSGFEMVIGYYLLAAISVGVGISKPRSWPSWFGSFIEGYNMRRIWGYCWHQNLRRIFETCTGWICGITGASQGSIGSWFIKLYGSFLISACIHQAGAMNVPYNSGVKYQFLFFMVQPLAITVEDAVRFLIRRYGDCGTGAPCIWKRALGYLWVISFLSFSLRYVAAFAFSVEFANLQHPITKVFSVADRVLGC